MRVRQDIFHWSSKPAGALASELRGVRFPLSTATCEVKRSQVGPSESLQNHHEVTPEAASSKLTARSAEVSLGVGRLLAGGTEVSS